MNDSRRLLFIDEHRICVIDSASGRVGEIRSVAPHQLVEVFALSRDNTLIAYAREIVEADVWLMEAPPD